MIAIANQNEISLQLALEAILAGNFTPIRAAATAHNVNPSTLSRRLNGGLTRSESHSKRQLLSMTREEFLCKWIIDLKTQGYAPNLLIVKEMILQILGHGGEPHYLGEIGCHALNDTLRQSLK
jgi:helix-turn-helix, Psq domain